MSARQFIALPEGSRFTPLAEEIRADKDGRTRSFLFCKCRCGNLGWHDKYTVLKGKSRSCGCFRTEKSKQHGASSLRAYKVWDAMVQRCVNPKASGFVHYGHRGISVCPEWRKFAPFYEFLKTLGLDSSGDIPLGMSIERKDNNGDYEPGNVCFARRHEQCRNRRANRLITIDGETKCVADWAIAKGISRFTIGARLCVGWDEVRAVMTPVIPRKRK